MEKELLKKSKKHKSLKYLKNPFFLIMFILLIAYSISLLAPILWGILTSLKSDSELSSNLLGLPKKWYFTNYIDALNLFRVPIKKDGGTTMIYIETMFLNSILYCVGCSVMATIAPCFVAYITAKYNKHKFVKVLYTIVIIVMIVPIVGNLPSEMQMIKSLGLFDKMIGSWILRFSYASMYFLIFYASFRAISWEYAEAAFIDGASHWKVMLKIMLPFATPTIIVTFLMLFIGFWNDYTIPMLYLPSQPTVAYGLFLYKYGGGQGTSTVPMQITGCMIVMVPILVLFLALKNKIMGNLMIGGLKG